MVPTYIAFFVWCTMVQWCNIHPFQIPHLMGNSYCDPNDCLRSCLFLFHQKRQCQCHQSGLWRSFSLPPFLLSLNFPDWRLAWQPTSLLFSSFSRGRSLLYLLLIALCHLLPSLLTQLAYMELALQCSTACTPFPPCRWTASCPHRYRMLQKQCSYR